MESLTHAFGGEVDLTDFDFKESVPPNPPADMDPRWLSLWSNFINTLTDYYGQSGIRSST